MFDDPETPKTIILRALKIYIFTAALVLIGEGFKPIVTWYLAKILPGLLYWAKYELGLSR